MAFVWLCRSTGRAPRLTKRARTMVDFREELPDRAAPKPYLHRLAPQLLVAARSLPFVASSWSCFPGPVGRIVRNTDPLSCFKHLPIWRERRCSVSGPSAGCFVHGGLGQFSSGPSSSGTGPGGGRPEVEPSPKDLKRFGPFSKGTIGKYKMGASLGEGGFGVVRAALNTETGDVVAIKVLNKEKWDSYWKADLRALLRREIFAMKTVSHPNIVQLLDVLASKERVFLVMELVFGGTLKEELEDDGALPEATARKYFQQMMTAVEFCHGKGVFHRDLKPENVLLDTRDGCIKVADFGLSTITYQTDITGAPRSVLLATNGGTPGYQAPEVRSSGAYAGDKADVFSCGATLYNLLTNARAFDCTSTSSSSLTEMERQKNNAAYTPLPEKISAGARELVSSMLHPDPSQRISVAAIFQDNWFKQGYQPPDFRKIKEVAASMEEIDNAFKEPPSQDYSKLEPAKLNAFALIAGAKSFNLASLASTLLQQKDLGLEERRYTSQLPALQVMERIIASMSSAGYVIQWKGYTVRMDAEPSRKGPFCAVAELFQAPHGLVCVDVRRVVGHSQEFYQFLRNFTTKLKDDLQLVEWSPEYDTVPDEDTEPGDKRRRPGDREPGPSTKRPKRG